MQQCHLGTFSVSDVHASLAHPVADQEIFFTTPLNLFIIWSNCLFSSLVTLITAARTGN